MKSDNLKKMKKSDIISSIKELNASNFSCKTCSLHENVLINNITEASKEESFYSLSIENISSILSQIDFNEIEDSLELIKTILGRTYKIHGNETIILLNSFKTKNFPNFTLTNYIEILSEIKSSEIFSKIEELYTIETTQPQIDWEYEVQERENQIKALTTELEPKRKKREERNILNSAENFPFNDERPDDYESNPFVACAKGKLSSIQYFYENENQRNKYENIELKDINQRTPIFFACKYGHLYLVRYFIEKLHVNIEDKDNVGNTILMIAVFYGHYDIVKYLCEKANANVDIIDNYGATIFHIACHSNLEIAKNLYEKYKIDTEAKDNEGKTAIFYAIMSKNIEIVKYLCENTNVNIEAIDNEGQTVLIEACRCCNLDIIQYLCENMNANIEARDNERTSVLSIACLDNNLETVQYLCGKVDFHSFEECGIKFNPLFGACCAGKLEIVKYLIEVQHADTEILNYFEVKPIDIAAVRGHLDVFKYLYYRELSCKNPDDINQRYVIAGTIPILDFLFDEVGVTLHDKEKTNILIEICSSEFFEKVVYLIEKRDFNPNGADYEGNTPLASACSKGNLEVVQYLCENQHVNPFTNPNDEFSPLTLAQNHPQILDYFNSLRNDS